VATREPVRISDPKAIRALAHPARLAVIEELYTGRELTATECAEISGLTPSAMSYHLRSLEQAGIVERAPSSGDGRERPWRAAGSYLQVESESDVGDAAALGTIVLHRLNDQFAGWLGRRAQEPEEWRDAAIITSAQVWLTPEELNDLARVVQKTLDDHRDRQNHPDGARRVRLSIFAFPAKSIDDDTDAQEGTH
jgi:DNA-binding transcriptional ArsR family regulator